MVIRIWQGIVLLANAAKYQALLEEKVLPYYRRADGNLGVYLCGEVRDEIVNFLVLSVWSSHDALVRFAGSDVDAMSHSNEEKQLLLAFESMARNYEVLQLLEPQKVSESAEVE
jgi:heme-degrading monooxygenase HmoA